MKPVIPPQVRAPQKRSSWIKELGLDESHLDHLRPNRCRDCGDPCVGELCARCPGHEWFPDPKWKPRDLVKETQIEPGIWVRTSSFDTMTKYGYCYRTFGVDEKTSRTQDVRWYYSRDGAEADHQACVNFVMQKRAERRRRGWR